MKNNYFICLGIDLIPPLNEKNVKIVESVRKMMPTNDYLIISIEKIKNIQNKNVCIIKKNKLGRIGQFFLLIANLFFIRISKINKKICLNVIWSGFGVADFLVLLISRVLLINTTYTIINKKQTEYSFLKLAKKIVVFSPDLLDLIKYKNKQTFFLVPNLFVKKYKRNCTHKLFLFTTIPIYEKNFKKRGVYKLFKLAKYIEKKDKTIKFLILNRWSNGSKVLEKLKISHKVNNIDFVHGSVKNIEKYYASSEALINLDFGSEIPHFSLSIAEAIMCSCPTISISNTWLTKKINNYEAGIISQPSYSDLYNSILKVHHNLKSFEDNCVVLSKELFLNNFAKKYLEILLK